MRAISLLAFATTALAGVDVSQIKANYYFKGHDLSSLRLFELQGVTYKDSARNNETRDAEDILGDGGMNTVRLRLWVDPTVGDQYGTFPGDYGINYTLPLAKRMYDKGYNIYLDFHFSNYWADPSKQTIPPSWPKELGALKKTLRNYVNSTLQTFHHAGVDMSLVSLGNEIRNGLLWPVGLVNPNLEPDAARIQNFTQMASLWASARQGVTDAVNAGVPKPQVMIHIDNGWDLGLQQRWFSGLTGSGHVHKKDWDVFGFSFYPFYGTGATLAALNNSLTTLANQYRKPIHVVETDWPAICSAVADHTLNLSVTSIPISPVGQTEWVQNITQVVKGLPHGLGLGQSYWEPAWINSTGLGSACEDNILFSTDWSHWPNVTTYSRSSVNMFDFPV